MAIPAACCALAGQLPVRVRARVKMLVLQRELRDQVWVQVQDQGRVQEQVQCRLQRRLQCRLQHQMQCWVQRRVQCQVQNRAQGQQASWPASSSESRQTPALLAGISMFSLRSNQTARSGSCPFALA